MFDKLFSLYTTPRDNNVLTLTVINTKVPSNIAKNFIIILFAPYTGLEPVTFVFLWVQRSNQLS